MSAAPSLPRTDIRCLERSCPGASIEVIPTSRPDRFVALKPAEEAAPPQADVLLVQNWRSEFAKK